jgi:hypothetical protein
VKLVESNKVLKLYDGVKPICKYHMFPGAGGQLLHDEDDCPICRPFYDRSSMSPSPRSSPSPQPEVVPRHANSFEPPEVLECPQYQSVLLTGTTDIDHVNAWGGHYDYYGRIRLYDGFIVLVQTLVSGASYY